MSRPMKNFIRRVLWLGQAGICIFERLFFEQIRHSRVDPVRWCVASDPTLSSFGPCAFRMLKCFSKLSFGIWCARHYRQCLFSRTCQDSIVYVSSLSSTLFKTLFQHLSGDGIVATAGAGVEDHVTPDPIPLPPCLFNKNI
jgi:hypothetical protein